MSRYTIRIDYTTGDTFRTEHTYDELGITWENVDKAKEALDRIVKLDEAIRDNDSTRWSKKEKIDLATIAGYSAEHPYSILLPLDDGSEHLHSMFWVGYFEHLDGVEVIAVSDPKMKW